MPIQRLMSDEALLQELGRRIARLRLERNLSQAQLAEQAGISKRTLERLELLLPEPQPSPSNYHRFSRLSRWDLPA
jgi:transcriptional regulator with XRE-family HTH domain